jgi:DNA-binding NarL/FixJ family response regulator
VTAHTLYARRRKTEPVDRPIRVLIVDRPGLMAESLQHALHQMDSRLRIVGLTDDQEEATRLIESHRPHVVLVDSGLGDDFAAELAQCVTDPNETAIVMLGDDGSEEALLAAIEAECRGYVDKQSPLSVLVRVIERSAAGEVAMPTDLLYRAVQRQSVKKPGSQGGVYKLTRRESEVLELIGRGLDNRTIAATMGVSLTTARGHVQRVIEKLGVHSKLQAMRYAPTPGQIYRLKPANDRGSSGQRSSKAAAG